MEEQECTSCDALFEVLHEMDGEYYQVAHCPFCGEPLDNEQYKFDEWDDEE